MPKNYIDKNVYESAVERIKYTFDHFSKIYVSFSGGKDSSVMTHLVLAEAKKRGVKVGLLFIDMEAQYQYTVQHLMEVYEEYKDNIIPFWVSIPIALSNAVSQFEPRWICWEPDKQDVWVRQPPKIAITNPDIFPFYKYPMEFEEFSPYFGKWFSDGVPTACFVGIRSDESLNRYRTIKMKNKGKYKDKMWTTKVFLEEEVYNVYPLYDWKTRDIWIYNTRYKKTYNKVYDLMYQAGVSIHEQRLCQPFGVDQRKGLYLYHVIEPETWAKLLSRVNGVNSGAEFVQLSGNISGQIRITLPKGHTWESFAKLLLRTMPQKLADHYDDKIHQFIHWWESKGHWVNMKGITQGIYNGEIPDQVNPKLEANRKAPSWRRICKSLLRNDYWCKGLSFAQTESHAYNKYKKMMKKRKEKRGYVSLWKI